MCRALPAAALQRFTDRHGWQLIGLEHAGAIQANDSDVRPTECRFESRLGELSRGSESRPPSISALCCRLGATERRTRLDWRRDWDAEHGGGLSMRATFEERQANCVLRRCCRRARSALYIFVLITGPRELHKPAPSG